MIPPFSSRRIRPDEWPKLAPYFTRGEFNHPDEMGFEFMFWLRDLRERVGFPLHPRSDHRPPARNAAAGGASQSAHLDAPCDAIDFGRSPTGLALTSAQRFQLIFTAREMGCRRFGVYENKAVHLDRAGGDKPQDVMWVSF